MIWPMFMRCGTPSGFRMMSTGVPSGRNGISSTGSTRLMTPLLPWRPAILSPAPILRFCAIETRTNWFTPGGQLVVGLAREDLDLDDLAALAVWHAQRRILDLARLLAEDRAQQLLLRRQLGLALWRDLADQDVAGADLGADVDDAVLVQVAQAVLADVRDVARDLLRAELRVARLHLVLLDVDAGEEVLAHDALADEDGVLEVAALPAHERDQDVLAQRQLATLGRGAIGDRLPLVNTVALVDDGPLVDARPLVRAHELAQLVRMLHALVVDDDDRARGRAHDLAIGLGEHHLAGVDGDLPLDARADDRRLRAQQRHRLALHVRAHQRAVHVVVLQERDQRGSDAYRLPWRNVHVVDARAWLLDEVAQVARQHARVDEMALIVERRVGLRDDEATLPRRRSDS